MLQTIIQYLLIFFNLYFHKNEFKKIGKAGYFVERFKIHFIFKN